jgi:hypothetical protein
MDRMRYLGDCSENEMIAAFLQAEIASPRFLAEIEAALRAAGLRRRIVTAPDFESANENQARRQLLSTYRGYGRDAGLFDGFPTDVRWLRALLDRDDLRRVRYIDYSYWVELSGGSRLPGDAARRIAADVEPFGVSNAPFRAVRDRLARGEHLADMIVVGASGDDDLVVLEGHLRLTAIHLLPLERRPLEIPAIVGISPRFADWPLY